MNGNGQVVVAGLFLLATMVVAMVAVQIFDVPTVEPEARPIELLDLEANEGLLSRAPIEMLHRYAGGTEQGLSPELIYNGGAVQDQDPRLISNEETVKDLKLGITYPGETIQEKAQSQTEIQAHGKTCTVLR